MNKRRNLFEKMFSCFDKAFFIDNLDKLVPYMKDLQFDSVDTIMMKLIVEVRPKIIVDLLSSNYPSNIDGSAKNISDQTGLDYSKVVSLLYDFCLIDHIIKTDSNEKPKAVNVNQYNDRDDFKKCINSGNYIYVDGVVKKVPFYLGYTGYGKTVSKREGIIYEGEFRDGVRSGKGTIYYENGNVYEGDCTDAEPKGTGKLIFSNGDVYEGYFDNGRRNVGKMTYSNGDVYEGEWDVAYGFYDDEKLIPIGNGKMIYANGDVYEGEFGPQDLGECFSWKEKSPVPNGKGKMTYANGDVYKGTFRMGKKYRGKLVRADR